MSAAERVTAFPVPNEGLDGRTCDAVCAVFAVWTVCCHVVVASGGSFHALIAVFALAMVALGFGLRRREGFRRGGGSPAAGGAVAASRTGGSALGSWAGAALCALGLGITLSQGGEIFPLSFLVVAGLLLAGAAAVRCEVPGLDPPTRSRRTVAVLWLLALTSATVTLVSHRPDIDDAFYVELAVSAVDSPRAPLLARDTLHGIEGLPLHLAVYQVHSYELWNALLSWLTGLPAIACFHFLSATMAAALVPLTHARLFRVLLPRLWLPSVAVLLLVLVGPGEAHRWYGNFAFVRMWQGKGIFLFVFLPLVMASALRYAVEPSRREWWKLTAAQIASIGATSTALWVGPLTAGIALAAAIPWNREGLRRGIVGGLASGYPVAVGLWVRGATERALSARPPTGLGSGSLDEAVVLVLGQGRLELVCVVTMALAWWLPLPALARRFAIAFPLFSLAGPLNPALAPWWQRYVTGPFYWRVLWLLPLPVLLTLVAVAPLAPDGARMRRLIGLGFTLVALAAYTLEVPSYGGLTSDNEVELAVPRLKVDPPEFAAAAALDRSCPARPVLAPELVSAWVPTLHHHAFPLQVRRYLRINPAYTESDVDERELLGYIANGEPVPNAGETLKRALARYGLCGVALRSVPPIAPLRRVLTAAGLEPAAASGGYEVWARTLPSGEKR